MGVIGKNYEIMKLTICIPTHTTKSESSGIYKNVRNNVPSTPSTKMIEKVILNINDKTDIDISNIKIIVGFDKRTNRNIDIEYHKNLEILCGKYNMTLSINESETPDPILTAPNNFMKLIDSVDTDYYLFWEHDWIFNFDINFSKVLKELDDNPRINYIRFNQHKNTNDTFDQFIAESSTVSSVIDLLPTHRWSNNPYICRTDVFQNWWKNFIYPTIEEGGFVEGPMNVFYMFYATKLGWEETVDKFGCYVYGKWNDEECISHLNGNDWNV